MNTVIYAGLDWGESRTHVGVVDSEGKLLDRATITEDVEGFRRFTELLSRHASDPSEVVIGTESDRGLLVQYLAAAGYAVYPINPLSASRYRDRHKVGGGKSDAADCVMLANVVRTDRHNHRPVAVNSDMVNEIRILSRRHQDLMWDRSRQVLRLRSTLRDYYPAALIAFKDGLTQSPCLAVLERAPTPAAGHKLTHAQIVTALKRGGRKRQIDEKAKKIHVGLATKQLELPPGLSQVSGEATASLARVLLATNREIAKLESLLRSNLGHHPDAEVILSLPGLSTVLGARVLAEFGDQPNRYADSTSRRNFSGVAPITAQSGDTRIVRRRYAKKRRLADACYQWADCAYKSSPGAKQYYRQLRQRKMRHASAIRALARRLVGILHACLRDHTRYDERVAWPQFNAVLKAA